MILSLSTLLIRRNLLLYICVASVFIIYFTLNSIPYGLGLPDLQDLTSKHDVVTTLLDDVLNSTLGFQKLLAINLPARTDHRDRIILQSALSGLQIEFVNGVQGDVVAEKALPPNHANLSTTEYGSWRAHANAIERVVREDLGSALVIEDDVDWDVRIRGLLKNFAIGAQAIVAISHAAELYFNDLPTTRPPISSPYGDDWDVLWLGHCGSNMPAKRIIQLGDETVPETPYLHSWLMDEKTPLSIYPNHTRVVLQSATQLCSLAYAVSQRGARKLLHDIAIENLNAPFDMMLQQWCENPENGNCISVLPQLFDHHRVRGPMSLESDIREKEGIRSQAVTNNVRFSVALNMEKLLHGDTNYDDQYPDTH